MLAIGFAMLSMMTGQSADATATVQDDRPQEQRLVEASAYGSMIYAFDRAAWVSTDSLLEHVPRDQLTGAGGYVIEPLDRETLRATYFKGDAADARAFFTANVKGGKVVRHAILPEPVPLTAVQMILTRAREIAQQEAEAKRYRPCTAARFNTVVLPSTDGGPVTAYLLSPQVSNAHYMMGGNYRIVIAPNGRIVGSRAFNTSCVDMPLPERRKGAEPAGLVVNHLLDPVPTEIHVFASYSIGLPLYVHTPDKRAWQVRGKDIAPFSLR